MKRVFNFNAGPATLPLAALEEASANLVNFNNSGMSLLEVSHRTPIYEDVHFGTISSIKEILSVPDDYEILFLQGGAHTQFSMVPMNLLGDNESADYIVTGSWSEKAVKEISVIGKKANVIADTKATKYNSIPSTLNISKDAKYLYLVSNETIQGVQFKKFPETNGVPLIVDASSDICSYPIDWKNIGIIYAGAQKNMGPAGVTIVIVRKDLIKDQPNVPTMLRYSTHAKENSLYNTPPVFSIYMVGLTMKWLKNLGGLKKIDEINKRKAAYIYDVIDSSSGFYKGHAEKDCRSLMNVTFTLATEELEKKLIKETEANNMVGLKGHRSVGGLRASIYNAMPEEGCKYLADFMKDFAKKNG